MGHASGAKSSDPLGPAEELSAWLVVTHPRDPPLVGKRLVVSSLGFSIGSRADDFAVQGATGTAAIIKCDLIATTAPSWTIAAMGDNVEVNDEKVVGAQALATSDRVRVLGYHFVFISGEGAEQQFYEVIYHLTIKDFATGLHNARFLGEVMDREVRRAAEGSVQLSVGVVRFDPCFTRTNEESVCTEEDLIRNFARHLRGRTPRDWTLALVADGELGLIARDTSGSALHLRLQQICDEFGRPSRYGVAEWTASSGAADLLHQARARCTQPSA